MPSPVLYPSLRCGDAEAEMDWLERTLGFERREEHRDPEGNLWAFGTYRPAA